MATPSKTPPAADAPPRILLIVAAIHAVLVVGFLVYVGATFGLGWALGVAVAYSLIWTVILAARWDNDRPLQPLVQRPSTIYAGPAPGTEDDD